MLILSTTSIKWLEKTGLFFPKTMSNKQGRKFSKSNTVNKKFGAFSFIKEKKKFKFLPSTFSGAFSKFTRAVPKGIAIVVKLLESLIRGHSGRVR